MKIEIELNPEDSALFMQMLENRNLVHARKGYVGTATPGMIAKWMVQDELQEKARFWQDQADSSNAPVELTADSTQPKQEGR